MKKLLSFALALAGFSAFAAAPIRSNFATTNDSPTLTNIVRSVSSALDTNAVRVLLSNSPTIIAPVILAPTLKYPGAVTVFDGTNVNFPTGASFGPLATGPMFWNDGGFTFGSGIGGGYAGLNYSAGANALYIHYPTVDHAYGSFAGSFSGDATALSKATTNTAGVVRVDGITMIVSQNGTISAVASNGVAVVSNLPPDHITGYGDQQVIYSPSASTNQVAWTHEPALSGSNFTHILASSLEPGTALSSLNAASLTNLPVLTPAQFGALESPSDCTPQMTAAFAALNARPGQTLSLEGRHYTYSNTMVMTALRSKVEDGIISFNNPSGIAIYMPQATSQLSGGETGASYIEGLSIRQIGGAPGPGSMGIRLGTNSSAWGSAYVINCTMSNFWQGAFWDAFANTHFVWCGFLHCASNNIFINSGIGIDSSSIEYCWSDDISYSCFDLAIATNRIAVQCMGPVWGLKITQSAWGAQKQAYLFKPNVRGCQIEIDDDTSGMFISHDPNICQMEFYNTQVIMRKMRLNSDSLQPSSNYVANVGLYSYTNSTSPTNEWNVSISASRFEDIEDPKMGASFDVYLNHTPYEADSAGMPVYRGNNMTVRFHETFRDAGTLVSMPYGSTSYESQVYPSAVAYWNQHYYMAGSNGMSLFFHAADNSVQVGATNGGAAVVGLGLDSSAKLVQTPLPGNGALTSQTNHIGAMDVLTVGPYGFTNGVNYGTLPGIGFASWNANLQTQIKPIGGNTTLTLGTPSQNDVFTIWEGQTGGGSSLFGIKGGRLAFRSPANEPPETYLESRVQGGLHIQASGINASGVGLTNGGLWSASANIGTLGVTNVNIVGTVNGNAGTMTNSAGVTVDNLASIGYVNAATNDILTGSHVYSGSNTFTGVLQYIGTNATTTVSNLVVQGTMTLSETNTAPSDPATVKAWFSISFTNGTSFKVPLYQ